MMMMTLRNLRMRIRWKNKLEPTIASRVGRQSADESPIDTCSLTSAALSSTPKAAHRRQASNALRRRMRPRG